jgi:hypothetical protein
MDMSKEWIKKDYLKKSLIDYLMEEGKEGDQSKWEIRRTYVRAME